MREYKVANYKNLNGVMHVWLAEMDGNLLPMGIPFNPQDKMVINPHAIEEDAIFGRRIRVEGEPDIDLLKSYYHPEYKLKRIRMESIDGTFRTVYENSPTS